MSLGRGFVTIMPFIGLKSKNTKKEDPIKEKLGIAYYARYIGDLMKFPKEEDSIDIDISRVVE
jgi:hypothetical protein